LRRRLIEARVIAPLLDAMSAEFGAERVRTIARDVIVRLAQEQGAQLADSVGGCSLAHFAGTLERWTADDALRIDVLEQSGERFDFNVTRCRYAEMYRELGIPELGAVLSCNRDAALIEGFNGEVEFSRTQTIMGGASHCDFRYTLRRAGP
jgi:predicted ArsR family transcriptional regulator